MTPVMTTVIQIPVAFETPIRADMSKKVFNVDGSCVQYNGKKREGKRNNEHAVYVTSESGVKSFSNNRDGGKPQSKVLRRKRMQR